jgi:hypothetical protein
VDSEFYSDSATNPFGPIWQTAEPLYLDASDVRLVACAAVGAGDISTTFWRPARYGVFQSGGTLTVGPMTHLAGGYDPNNPPFFYRQGVSSLNNGVVVLDPTATLGRPYGCLCPIQQSRTIPAVRG